MLVACWWCIAATGGPVTLDTVPVIRDTPVVKTSWWKRNLQELKNKRYRDSLLSRLSRDNATSPGDDSSIQKSEHVFLPQQGRHIRRIYFRRVQVFGPNDIYDTTFQSSNRLLKLANNMHYDSRQWVIKQSLFFHPGDTVNAYELADNERYLRNLPFIQDARIYLTSASSNSDSVDINVVTKDVFEYGGDLSELSNTNAKFDIYNNDLFGAGQSFAFGFLWDKTFMPRVGTQVQYTKSNIGGTFIDGSVGYTYLNNNAPLDTNTYEGSYYISLNRPLYRRVTPVIGGLSLAKNFSINIHSLGDSLYRNYQYNIVDAWVGYNCWPGMERSNGSEARGPSLAILLRHYNLYFTQYPIPQYKADPVYNNRRYLLGEFALYRQDFFKAHYFFGFGRTEDVPLGYTIGLYGGEETWVQRQRAYSGLNLQKYWVTPLKGLLNTQLGLSSFWHPGTGSEDAVIHGEVDYYSRLVTFPWSRFREFIMLDYLDCPNPFFYKPLNINNQFGIYGISNTQINGFQRLNMRAYSNFYTPLKVYGFKFNLQATIQTSQLAYRDENLFDNRLYAGFGLGCEVRNENLTFNTLKIDANYYPYVPPGMRGNFYFEITTVSDFRFNIFALTAPSYLSYR
ncbi:BamA/TamA family outer membrane protein [Dinghuibacter silviterrae]|uniref:Surface antigen-like variable number repeat protein n=1 Tax=Dinghuibacter silviterrae TaxID=1539049 RepID=A0A4R8DPI9_9BACT|nr:hypothetical protein [Dinghuibacter silviterrae]TDW99206.1 hypothetical protein EDB95_0215 [Dinghuibacter silviterrae]